MGHIEIVKYLLSKGADIDKQKYLIWTPLQGAVLLGRANVVIELINSGANVDFDKNGMTAISIAVSKSRWEIAKIIVEHSNAPFNYFVKSNDIDVVKYLISQKVDVNKPDNNNETPLSCAFQNENLEMVKHLLENGAHFTADLELIEFSRKNKLDFVQLLVSNGANVNARNDKNETSLLFAAKNNNVEMIEYLLEHNAHFSIHTAFLESIDGGNKEIVELLINKGANVNQKYRNGLTPLLKAIEARDLELVNLLIENDADVNLTGGNGILPLSKSLVTKQSEVTYFLISMGAVMPDSFSLLMANIEEKNFEMVKTTIEQGKIDLNTIDEQSGHTPLIKSVKLNYREMVQYLIEKGANVNQVDKSGNSPLSIAVSNDHQEIITLLISKGASVENHTSLLMSSIAKRDFKMATSLIENGLKVNFVDENGFTPITKSMEMKYHQMVRYLVEKGADVNLVDRHQNSPLSVAISNLTESDEDIETIKFLISEGAHARDYTSFLMTMIEKRNFEMCTFLIDNGVNLDKTDESGLTPLTKSAQMNYYLLVQCLTENGADVNQRDDHQDTALSVAASTSNMKIFDYLVQSGASIDTVRGKLDKVAANNEDFAIYLETMTQKDDSNQVDSSVPSQKGGNNSKWE